MVKHSVEACYAKGMYRFSWLQLLPKGTPAAPMRAELGQHSIRDHAYLALLKFWSKGNTVATKIFSKQCFQLYTLVCLLQ